MTASELGEWRKYLALDPRGEDVTAVLLAQLCSLVAGMFHSGKGKKPPTPEDFLRGLYPERPGDKRGDDMDKSRWSPKQWETYRRFQASLLNYKAEVAAKRAKKG